MSPGAAGKPRVVIVGAAGQLGYELTQLLAAHTHLTALTRQDLDFTNETRLRAIIRAVAPAAVINTAAYNNVDLAESQAEIAFAVNANVPRVLAEEASALGALMVHYSTDYVFDGKSRSPYLETSPPNPLSVYGESKLAGEHAVAAAGGAHLIFRVAWLYGAHERSFARMVLRVARGGRQLRFVDDQVGSPTWSRRVATVTVNVLRQLAEADVYALPPDAAGIFHLTSSGATTRFEQAMTIVSLDRHQGEAEVDIRPISAAEFGAPARRPPYSVLDTGRIRDRFGVQMPHWRTDLEEAMPSISDAAHAARATPSQLR
jgi:dTDP-4-dehydrorhamnose reductase